MNAKFLTLSSLSYTAITQGMDRSRVLSLATGMASAALVSIPSTPVENPQAYYNAQCIEQVRDIISQTNEQCVLMFDEACEYALSFWRMRYYAAHPVPNLSAPSPYGFFDTVLGAQLFVSPETHTFANQYKKEVFELRDRLKAIFDAMGI